MALASSEAACQSQELAWTDILKRFRWNLQQTQAQQKERYNLRRQREVGCMEGLTLRPRIQDKTRWRNEGTKILVLSAAGRFYTIEEETGTLVWSLCDGNHTVADIAELVLKEFEVSPETATTDTLSLLKELEEHQIITLSQG